MSIRFFNEFNNIIILCFFCNYDFSQKTDSRSRLFAVGLFFSTETNPPPLGSLSVSGRYIYSPPPPPPPPPLGQRHQASTSTNPHPPSRDHRHYDRVRFRIYFIFYRPSPRHIPFRWVPPRRRTSVRTTSPPPNIPVRLAYAPIHPRTRAYM